MFYIKYLGIDSQVMWNYFGVPELLAWNKVFANFFFFGDKKFRFYIWQILYSTLFNSWVSGGCDLPCATDLLLWFLYNMFWFSSLVWFFMGFGSVAILICNDFCTGSFLHRFCDFILVWYSTKGCLWDSFDWLFDYLFDCLSLIFSLDFGS